MSSWQSRFGPPPALVAAAVAVLGIAGSSAGAVGARAAAATPGQGPVRVVELGAFPGGHGSAALAINAAGQVVGHANTAAGKEHAAVWRPAGSGSYSITDLGALPGGDFSFASALDSNGVVAGSANTAPEPNAAVELHAALWRPTGSGSYRVTDLGTLPGGSSSSAFAVNADGVVAGAASTTDTSDRAVVWRPSAGGSYSITELGTLPGDRYGRASGINAGGVIAGYSGGADHGRAVIWRPTSQGSYSVTDLGVLPGGAYSGAYAVNDAGVVAGYSYRSDTDIDAVVWRPSSQGSYSITDLGKLPGSLSSYTHAINDAGVIAGDSSFPGQQEAVHHAVTWMPTAAGSYAISELPVPSGESDGTAFAINDAGVVAGDSFSSSGEEHALVWTGTRP